MESKPSSKFQNPINSLSFPIGEQSILSWISCGVRAAFQISTLSKSPSKGPTHPEHPPVNKSPISKGIVPTVEDKLKTEEPVNTPSK